ncbi:alkaline phosphatase family protein [Streptomyces sp. NPDC059909]|uniref:alkaline phosphatase family protein n=1 Tax=Streptomyces sp. NPDC059909 TaxID=3346998 RepID=UPI003664CB7D
MNARDPLPPSLRRVLRQEPAPGGLDAVKHVVILMQENRSFDHYFGTLPGVRGFADRNAIELPSGAPVFAQPAGERIIRPFLARAAAGSADLDTFHDLDHGWQTAQEAWHGGWMDRWVPAKTPATMAYLDRADIPLHFALADAFTVCDAYHASIHSSTSPNRNYLWSSVSAHEPDGRRAVDNDAYDEDVHPGYAWPSYAELLQRAGRSWRTYSEWENYTDNQVEFFAPFKAVARKALIKTGGHTYMESFYAALRQAAGPAERQRLLGLLEEGVAALDPGEHSLFERGLRRLPTGTLTEVFAADVADGRLPEVSYVVFPADKSEHPNVSSPQAGAQAVYELLDALASHPEVWRHTVLLLTYDENDGLFDHVPPPVPAPDGQDEWWQGQPTGLGMRVPMLVVSPWSAGGHVCSELFDHTSVNRFLERWTGVEDPNVTAWRRRVTGDLTSAFDFGSVGSVGSAAPDAPPGTRQARPLPYRPEACAVVADGRAEVVLGNSGSRSVHFALYPYAGEFAVPQHQDIEAAGRWTFAVGDRYRFTVTGPNGFRREFAGTAEGGAQVSSSVDPGTREVGLTLTNSSPEALTFTIRPQGYADDPVQRFRVAPGASLEAVHPAAAAAGWYDLVVTVEGDTAFHRRLMGHIENGQPSVPG